MTNFKTLICIICALFRIICITNVQNGLDNIPNCPQVWNQGLEIIKDLSQQCDQVYDKRGTIVCALFIYLIRIAYKKLSYC